MSISVQRSGYLHIFNGDILQDQTEIQIPYALIIPTFGSQQNSAQYDPLPGTRNDVDLRTDQKTLQIDQRDDGTLRREMGGEEQVLHAFVDHPMVGLSNVVLGGVLAKRVFSLVEDVDHAVRRSVLDVIVDRQRDALDGVDQMRMTDGAVVDVDRRAGVRFLERPAIVQVHLAFSSVSADLQFAFGSLHKERSKGRVQRRVLLEFGLAFADVLQIAGQLTFLHEMILREHPVLLQPQKTVLLLLLDGWFFGRLFLAASRALAAHLKQDPFDLRRAKRAVLNLNTTV